MNGPSEFHVIGTLKNWDITASGSARFACRRSSSPGGTTRRRRRSRRRSSRGIPGSESVIFEESAHMCHVEEPETFLRVVTDFLSRVEANEQR